MNALIAPLHPVVVAIILIIAAIVHGPSKENDTVGELRRRHAREEQEREQQRSRSAGLEQERQELRRMEAARKLAEEEFAKRLAEQRRMQAETKMKEEERRKKRNEENLARKKSEEAKKEHAEKMRKLEEREKELKEAMDRAHAARMEAQKKVFGVDRAPTQQEFQDALRKTGYDSSNFHFAIVGGAGSGKSSLINAFRNLRSTDAGASRTGTKETTLTVGRYPDPGTGPPRQYMVWYDVPGVGTQRTPHRDYFVKQGLYVFDLIILAIGDRFAESDVRILKDCKRFNIPTFIVRSKADMHILNEMKESVDCEGFSDDPQRYAAYRDKFVAESRNTVGVGLRRAGLADQTVYIVSRDRLRETYNGALHHEQPRSAQLAWQVIHERELVNDLLKAAADRRCGTGDSDDGTLTEISDLPGSFPEDRRPAAAAGRRPQAAPNVRKVVHPRAPTNGVELLREMVSNEPELRGMVVGTPRMLASQVAVLTFRPAATIPREIAAFGQRLKITDYKELNEQGAKGHNQGGGVEGGGNTNNGASGKSNKQRGRKGGGKGRGKGRGKGKGVTPGGSSDHTPA